MARGSLTGVSNLSGITFNNNRWGQVSINNGLLIVGAGTSSGRWLMAPGSQLIFAKSGKSSTFAINSGSSFEFDSSTTMNALEWLGRGAGGMSVNNSSVPNAALDPPQIVIAGGTLIVNIALSVPRLFLESGVLGGQTTVTITNRMVWVGGTMSGGGTTYIDNNASIANNASLYAIGNLNFGSRLLNISTSAKYGWFGDQLSVANSLPYYGAPGSSMNIRITSSTTLQQIIDQMTPNLVAGYGDMSDLVGQVVAKLQSQDARVIDLFASSGLARAALAAAYNWRTDRNLISDVTTKLRFATYTASSGNQYAAARWGVRFLQYGEGDPNMVIARQNETQIAKQNAVLAAISYPIVGRYVNPEFLRAAGSGLLIGAKGTVNGLTTSVANLFKLGFAGDLHPWAPTQDDIANGYSTSFVWGNVAGELLLTAATMGLSQAACAPGRVATVVRWTNRGITVLNLANTTINGGRAI
jgi:hypothetical protein